MYQGEFNRQIQKLKINLDILILVFGSFSSFGSNSIAPCYVFMIVDSESG